MGLGFFIRREDFLGEAFVVEWALSVGWASDWEEIRYSLNNCTGVGDIVKWGCDGFVGTLAMCELRLWHGHFPLFS